MLGKKLLTVTPSAAPRNVLYGWGNSVSNESFEDGLPFQHRSSPVQIGLKSWKTVINTVGGFASIDDINRLWFKGSLGLPFKTTPYSWNQISVGLSVTTAIRSDGTLWTWGTTAGGQLANNVPGAGVSSPIQIGSSSWSVVSVGTTHTTAIRIDGALFAWGGNSNGTLGLNDTTNRSSPVQIGTSSWSTVSAGQGMTAAIRSDGALFTWGQGESGQLGHDRINYSWNAIGMVGDTTIAIRSDKTLWMWGALLGASTGSIGNAPILIPDITYSSWSAVSAGQQLVFALASDGGLWGWGNGNYLGLGDFVSRSSPIQIGATKWSSVYTVPYGSAGSTFAIRLTDSTLWHLGSDSEGSSGRNARNNVVTTLTQVSTSSWTQISNLNSGATAALRTDGALFTWGWNGFGQLGQNDRNHRSSPIQIGTSSWSAISSSGNHILAIRSDGGLFAWGDNAVGALGQNDLVHRSSPVQIGTSSWIAVAASTFTTPFNAGQTMSYAIRSDGALFTWGTNGNGVLGLNDVIQRSSPVQVGTSSWSQVVAGVSHVLAIRSDGALFVWGGNSNGQLGDGTTANKSSPIQLGTSSWISITGGFDTSAARRSDGALFIWGGNGTHSMHGMLDKQHRSSPIQIGTFAISHRSSPIQIGTSSWNSIGTGLSSIFLIRSDGTLWGWGGNNNGVLGLNDSLNRNVPELISTSSWTQVSSFAATAAIRSDGALFTWGSNGSGSLGQNNTVHRSSPVQIGTSSWMAVKSSSSVHAIRIDNTLWSWGENGAGQIGVGDQINRSSPVQVPGSWTKVAGSVSTTFAIRSDTTLWGWGYDSPTGFGETPPPQSWVSGVGAWWGGALIRSDGALFTWATLNSFGQTGHSDTIGRSSPTQVGTSSWSQVEAGLSGLLAIRSDGGLFAWGNNTYGQLGQNNTVHRSSPVQIGTSSWLQVSARGGATVLALRTDGALFGWGHNTRGQLGLNDTAHRSSPVQIGTSSWTNVSTRGDPSFGQISGGVRSDGTLWTWGGNSIGIGHTSSTAYYYSWVAVGNQYMAAVQADGSLWAWGDNTYGQLGLNDRVHRSSPVQVGASSWTMVDTNPTTPTTSAIRSDGALFMWGLNDQGQLGLNDRTHRSSPVQIGTSSWTSVSVGVSHTLAILSDGTLWGWGRNKEGQLGDNTAADRSSPVQISTSSWTSVSAGGFFSTAVRSDGALFAWGANHIGQLGLNDRTHRSSPVQIGTSSWTTASAGSNGTGGYAGHVLAIRSDGTLWAWGGNALGQLGLSNLVHRSSPTQVGVSTNDTTNLQYTTSWRAVAAGDGMSLAIHEDYSLWAFGSLPNGAPNGLPTFGADATVSRPVRVGLPYSTAGVYNTTNATVSNLVQTTTQLYRSVARAGQPIADVGAGAAIGLGKTLFTWGRNNAGQLGLNDRTHRSSPVQIGGTAATVIDRSSPVQVGVGPAGWSKVFMTSSTAYGITNDGLLWSLGGNATGMATNWTGNFSQVGPLISTPTYIGGTQSWTMVASGSQASSGSTPTYGVDSTGALWGWGSDGSYNSLRFIDDYVGNARTNQDNIRRNRATGDLASGVVSASIGDVGSVVIIKNNGAAYVGGSSQSGQGIGVVDWFTRLIDTTPISPGRSSPVQISAGVGGTSNGWIDITSVQSVQLGLKNDGTMWSWGLNQVGQRGIGVVTAGETGGIPDLRPSILPAANTTSSTTINYRPLRFWATLPVNQASNGQASHIGAIRADGALFMWGGNGAGQLGMDGASAGSGVSRSSPTQLGVYVDGTTTYRRSSPIQVGTSSWTQVFVNKNLTTDHVLAIREDGALFAWGSNVNAQGGYGLVQFDDFGLGQNSGTLLVVDSTDKRLWSCGNADDPFLAMQANFDSFAQRSVPSVVYSAAGQYLYKKLFVNEHNVIAQTQNKLWLGWGRQNYGQLLKDPARNRQLSPVVLSAMMNKSWITVCPGNTTYAIDTDYQLWGWGFGGFGLLSGGGDDVNRSSPVQIGTSSWVAVSCFASSMAAIRSDGALFVQGFNVNGKLGLNDRTHRSSMVQVGTSSWSQVAVSLSNMAAIRSDGALFIWGMNSNGGNLGQNDIIDRSSPVQVGTSSWAAVAVGDFFTLAIRADGTLWAWGQNGFGQLGQNNLTERSSPVQIGTATNWLAIRVAASGQNCAAKNTNNELWTWGSNSAGGLGIETTAARSTPVQIIAPTSTENRSSPTQVGIVGDTPSAYYSHSWVAVTAGLNSSYAIRSDRALFAWGSNTLGQLGINNGLDRSLPTRVGTSSWTSISAASRVVALRADGSLWGWGGTSLGGTGESGGPTYQWSQISVGTRPAAAAFAIREDGGLFMWGTTTGGGAGLNIINAHRSSPVQVGTSSWVAVSFGGNNSLAIRSDGALFTWGNNGNGELGLNDLVHRSSPTQVGTDSWTVVSSGATSSLNGGAAAIRSDGGLFTWGQNIDGSGGFGVATSRRSSPVQVGTSSWTFVDYTGGVTLAALRADGALFVSGRNTTGQLGQDDVVHRSSPVQVGTSSWIAVSNGGTYTFAIRSDNTLWAWGENTYGQLGLNDRAHRSSPVQVGTSRWTAVACDGGTAHAIRLDGTLWGWGNGTDGTVGDASGFAAHRSSPVQIGSIFNKFTKIDSAGTTVAGALAIDTDGQLWVWGSSDIVPHSGAVPISRSSPIPVGANFPYTFNGVSINFRSSPVIIGPGSWTNISSVGDTIGAIESNGRLYTWGAHTLGLTGLGLASGYRLAPQQVGGNYYFNEGGAFRDTNTGSWAMISSTYGNHYGGIKTDGSLWLWGWNGAGQASPQYHVWYGTTSSGAGNALSSPTQLGTSSWSVVSTGQTHTAAIRSDGTLWVWGFNSSGQVGDNTTIHRSSPLQVGTSSWISVAAGTSQTAAVRSDGTLWVWGANFNGELGQNDRIHRSSPVQVGTATAWKYVVALESNVFALGTGDGNLWSIGGASGLNIAATTPLYSWTKVSVSGSHTMAIRSDGTLWVWGAGTDGALGLSDTVHRSSPVQVGTSSWTQIAAGRGTGSVGGNSYAIRSDGALFAWGGNTLGQLGQNNLVARSSPVQVGTSSWTAVAAFTSDRGTVLAIRSDGALFAWGDNAIGLLGQNNLIHRSSPVQIGTSSWTQVATAMYSAGAVGVALARRSDGGLFAWGMNTNGELGQNDRVHRSSPVQIGTSSWTQLAVRGTAAIRSDGALFMWGYNEHGQLGQNNLIHRSSPVQVGTFSWTAVTSMQATAAIRSDGTIFMWGYGRGANAPILGRHDGISRSSPVQIVSAGTSTWSSLDGSYLGNPFAGQRTIAIGTNGLLYTWGDNLNGQLGLNSGFQFSTFPGYFMPTVIGSTFVAVARSSPVQVTSQDSWTWIGSGSVYSAGGLAIAQKNDGTLWAWGNVNGRFHAIPYFGVGSGFSSPVQIVGTGVGTSWARTQTSLGLFPATIGTPAGALLSI